MVAGLPQQRRVLRLAERPGFVALHLRPTDPAGEVRRQLALALEVPQEGLDRGDLAVSRQLTVVAQGWSRRWFGLSRSLGSDGGAPSTSWPGSRCQRAARACPCGPSLRQVRYSWMSCQCHLSGLQLKRPYVSTYPKPISGSSRKFLYFID